MPPRMALGQGDCLMRASMLSARDLAGTSAPVADDSARYAQLWPRNAARVLASILMILAAAALSVAIGLS
jgi:hypothetical protein